MIMASYDNRHFWLRIGRFYFLAKDVRRWPLLFSQRSGRWPHKRWGNYYFEFRKV